MQQIRIGITHGDTNGIGYEVILKAFSNPTLLELCTPIIYSSPKIAAFYRKSLELEVNYNTISNAEEAVEGELNIVDIFKNEVAINPGTPTEESGHAALESLEAAMTDIKEGLIDALVTAPIDKKNIQSDHFHFCGHTEYIESCMGESKKALMMMVSNSVRIATATTHLPIERVQATLNVNDLTNKLLTLDHSLRRDFIISMPRIAVLALNPHASDNGLIGKTEAEIITPAIEKAEELGVSCFGPYPADGFFGSGAYTHFDAILAMYHDQGMIPFKLLAMENGVNFTAGLPIIRTSPDHGTAFDIAGKGEANAQSFQKAIYAAIDICRNREQFDEAHSNPLQKLNREKPEDRSRGKLNL